MVMRCVLKHHVCLCVLSTAVLAGLALITAQTKVYAKSLNCNGFVNDRASGDPDDPSGDSKTGKIECDGEGRYEKKYGKGKYERVTGGIGGSSGELSGDRTIDMGADLKPAVKVHGGRAEITIVGKLTITDKSSKSTGPAIQVEKQGKLTLNDVNATGVYKGILVKDSKSSVTVLKGSIGVRRDGDYVIGVKDGGEVTLMRGVTVNGGGIVVGQGGGTVTLVGTSFSNVKTGIVFMGNGKANATVMGGGAKINLASGGTGVIMQGKGRGEVMNMTIQGRGGIGADVTDGALMLNMVTIEGVGVGARVTKGTLTVMGEAMISGTTMGADVSGSGVLTVMGNVMIMVTGRNGTGLKVTGGSATMVGGSIQGSGGVGSYGVIVDTSGTVELSGGVEVSRFETGVYVKGGCLR
ncbi:hypothetical protein BscR1v2_012940 [Bartonella schoenbuchensis R1]|uniref:Right handed beta helix region n=2 Tax=Bartonella schoenbuchensis TaxID=165694 RepID=A0A1S6XRR1_BARSR|nr:hypothetical protein BscR1v2_012940 [Bartonella schoenbuchensis R1]